MTCDKVEAWCEVVFEAAESAEADVALVTAGLGFALLTPALFPSKRATGDGRDREVVEEVERPGVCVLFGDAGGLRATGFALG